MTTTLSQSIQPQVRTIDGLSIGYAESEPRNDHALLLSPWPESIYCYEPTWSATPQRRRRARTISRPSQASASPSRCATCALTRSSCRCCATCCPLSRRRCRSSRARGTSWCRRSTPSSARAAAQEQARPHRRLALHLGGRGRPVRSAGDELVGRRLRKSRLQLPPVGRHRAFTVRWTGSAGASSSASSRSLAWRWPAAGGIRPARRWCPARCPPA